MGISLFGIGVSGMSAAQLGLATTGHNITNASTPGFSRQRSVQVTNIPFSTGSGFVGLGTQVSTIERLYSSILAGQVNNAMTRVSELTAYQSQISQIDNMLADPLTGLSPALQQFFSGVNDVASNPALASSRQSMISSAQTLTARFQTLNNRLNELYKGVNDQIGTTVDSINAYAREIANLNQQIATSQASMQQPPNDLLDKRDLLVSQMNELVKVSVSIDRNGAYNVAIGSGQQLVTGVFSSDLVAMPSSADASRTTVGIATPGGPMELPERLVVGGSLGGLLDFRSTTLDRTANQIGQIAASIALTFNAQHGLGQDLLGNVAGDPNFTANFFNITGPRVIGNLNNPAASPTVSASFITPPPFNGQNFTTDLTSSDYRLSYDGTNTTLTRLSDNKSWTVAGNDVNDINTLLAGESQGFTLDSTGGLLAGTSYLIQPTRAVADSMTVNPTIAANPSLIAAAAPFRTNATTTNAGDAVIAPGRVGIGYSLASLPATLTYDNGNLTGFPAGTTVTVTVNGVATDYVIGSPADPVPYTSGAKIAFDGMDFTISGTPANGDTFTIARNTSGTSDNRNALLLSNLQTVKTMSGGLYTFQDNYANLVGDVGNKAREINVGLDAQDAMLSQAQANMESLSGVNLDEEAANLLRYQTAYQASARIIESGIKIFDTLLSLGS
ncbi:MAG: flagellar hook-associated protein FlgK [Betaproteobacteria bacterium]|nr:flagellar hook-associated protein FlgK [Betaproteobacteria bacterium]